MCSRLLTGSAAIPINPRMLVAVPAMRSRKSSLAAMVVADAVLRKLPGALGDAERAVEESFSEALEGATDYPHYTRPASYRGWDVPDILLSGDHARVESWRREQSRIRSAR